MFVVNHVNNIIENTFEIFFDNLVISIADNLLENSEYNIVQIVMMYSLDNVFRQYT